MIAKDSIKDLVNAIHRASEDSVDVVEVDINDLLSMVNRIDDLEGDYDYMVNEVDLLREKIKMLNISLAKCELEAITKPVKLNYYA